MKLLRYMNMRNSMKKVSLIGVCLTVTSMVVAQNVMVVKYNNGDNRYEDVGDIKEITFIKTDEVDDNTPNDVTAGLVAYYTFDNKNCSDSQGQYYGFENGASYIIDTPNGTGYSLYLKKGEYISIGSSPLNLDKRFWCGQVDKNPERRLFYSSVSFRDRRPEIKVLYRCQQLF